jgi:hypothetical protein
MSDFITVLRETCPTPVVDATKWKRIGGDPHTVNLNAYLSPTAARSWAPGSAPRASSRSTTRSGSSATSSLVKLKISQNQQKYVIDLFFLIFFWE